MAYQSALSSRRLLPSHRSQYYCMISRLSFRHIASNANNARASCCRLPYAVAAELTSRSQFRSLSTELPTPDPAIPQALHNPLYAVRNVEHRGCVTSLPPEKLLEAITFARSEIKQLGRQVRILREERNIVGKTLASNDASSEQKDAARQRAEEIREELKIESTLKEHEATLMDLGLQLPNVTSPDTPIGGYDDCQVVRQSRDENISSLNLQASTQSDHVQVLTSLGWLHTPTNITGSGWPFLIGGGAALEIALTRFALEEAANANFELVIPPDVVKHDVMQRCGFAPRDSGGEAQTYFVNTSIDSTSKNATLALAATAEVPLAGLFADKLYKEPRSELPIKYAALGHAFRAEAGSRGRESRGLYRVHQFTKIELFVTTIGEIETSQAMLHELVNLQWKVLSALNLPLRMLNMSTQELGAAAYQKYDIEAWMPGRGSWGELASASNCTDYQARRLMIRHRSLPDPSSKATHAKTTYAHTLNATALAIPRLIVALVENGVRFDHEGKIVTIVLPEVLKQHWLGPQSFTTSDRRSVELCWS